MSSGPVTAPLPGTAPARLMSVDALRGFDMFWIVGGDAIGQALDKMAGRREGIVHTLALQLDHAKWEGFRFYDLIFPLFLFLVGVSLVFSLGRIVEREGRRAATLRILRRALLLWVLGVLYYGGWSKGVDGIRLLGVLQRIALCYLAAGLLFVRLRPRGLLIALVALLGGYWALMSFVPAPGQAQVSFEESKNLANWIDAHFLPLRRWDGDHDPEGLLSTLPAIGSCLLGVFAGLLLRDGRRSPARKAQLLFAIGAAAILAGWLWGFQFPVIKKIWTSSFVLLAGGWSAVLLGASCWLVDGMGLQRWVQPFVWVGLNPIAIYLLDNVLDFEKLAARVLGGPVHDAADSVATGLGEVVIAAGGTALAVLVCWFLHRRRLYLRV